MTKPNCYNRQPFKDTVEVQVGWVNSNEWMYKAQLRRVETIHDPMSKGCQQHGPMGEATLHPDKWDCGGCRWKPCG